jgi:hypothetical protein
LSMFLSSGTALGPRCFLHMPWCTVLCAQAAGARVRRIPSRIVEPPGAEALATAPKCDVVTVVAFCIRARHGMRAVGVAT